MILYALFHTHTEVHMIGSYGPAYPAPSLCTNRPQRPDAFAGLAVLILMVSICVPATQAQQLTRTPVEVRVPHPPVPIQALGRQHLVYELHLTNFGTDSLRLDHLNVRDANQPDTQLASSTAADLARRFRVIGQASSSTQAAAVLPPGTRCLLYQWVTLAPGAPGPQALLHEFVFGMDTAPGLDTLRTDPLLVATQTPATIEAPVASGRWVAARGPSNGSGHRLSLVVLDGTAQIPERFAVDWVRLGADGRLFSGDPHDNANWFGYDQSVHAVAPGQVVLVRDGLPEHPPLAGTTTALPFTPETVTGNTVVIAIGPHQFAVYAHLRPGSISVEEGDHVEAGQEIGRIGNSGHSLAPHLHFHLEDHSAPLAGEGLPFVVSSFELLGRLDSLPQALQGAPWMPHPARPARTVAQEILLENMVIEIR